MSGVSSLAALARARGLDQLASSLVDPSTATLLAPAPPPDPALATPPPDDPIALLGRMRRAGLDPSLVARLWPWFADRPVERGLFAWDVLTTTLLPDDHPLGDTLRAAASFVSDILPGPGERGIGLFGPTTTDLVAELAAPTRARAAVDEQLDLVAVHDLGAIERLRDRGPRWVDLLARSGMLEATRGFAELLSHAHLPTLASFYLDYLWRSFGHRPALADLCEVLLDAGCADRLPTPAASTSSDLGATQELIEYVTYRAGIVAGDPGWAYGLLKASRQLGISQLGARAGTHPRLDLVRAELTARIGESEVPYEVVDRIVRARPGWRYATRVRALLAAAHAAPDSDEPLRHLDGFLAAFGNDALLWQDLLDVAPVDAAWAEALCRRIAREAASLPHEESLWCALALVGDGGWEAVGEIRARLRSQSALL